MVELTNGEKCLFEISKDAKDWFQLQSIDANDDEFDGPVD